MSFLSENFQFLEVKFSICFEEACFRNEIIGQRRLMIASDKTQNILILFLSLYENICCGTH